MIFRNMPTRSLRTHLVSWYSLRNDFDDVCSRMSGFDVCRLKIQFKIEDLYCVYV